MTDPADSTPATDPGRGRAVWITGASVIAAVSALAVSVIAGRTLEAAAFREYQVYWAILFGIFGAVAGVQNEATRAATAVRLGARPGAPLLLGVTLVALGAAALVGVSAAVWGPAQLPATWPWILPVLLIALVVFSWQAGLAGSSAGRDDWNPYAWLIGAEALGRLGLVLVAALAGWALGGLEAATAAGTAVAVTSTLLLFGSVRRQLGARADVELVPLVRNLVVAVTSAIAYAVLVVGFPAVLSAAVPSGQDAEIASLIAAISLTRSPIMMPLTAFQGVAIAAFTARREGRLAALLKPMAIIGAIGVVGAGAAWLLGPWLFRLLYGTSKGLGLPGWTFAVLVLAAVSIAWLTLTGTATIAASAHRTYLIGWVTAAVATVLVVFLPGPALVRAPVALLVGPLVGAGIHLAVLRGLAAQPSEG